jgi:preprotein translocase SecE subunit
MSSTPTTPKGPTSIPTYRSKRGWKGYFAEVGREMKKVNWPTRAETNRLTGVVFAVCFIVGIILFALSTVFEHFVSLVTSGSI